MCKYMKLWVFAILPLFFGIAEGSRWSKTGDSNGGRGGGSGAILTNGKVIMTTGWGLSASNETYEIFDPATGTWPVFGPLPKVDGGHTMAILLPNGNVLHIIDNLMVHGEFYLYNPGNDSWTPSAVKKAWEGKVCATLLQNGRVLLMHDGKNCILYHHDGDSATVTGSADVKHGKAAEVLLPTGEVLIMGSGDATSFKKCELYNPITGIWDYTDSMNVGRCGFVGVLLPPPWNQVLVAGGTEGSSCELYDLADSSWSITSSLNEHQRDVPTMALLPSGEAMIIGGSTNNSCELYNYEANSWNFTSDMERDRNHFSAAVLYTGKVMAIGEFAGGKEHEIYDPSDGKWEPKKSLYFGRAAHTVTPLPIIPTKNCSTTVLIVGGENGGGALKKCELYNYSLEHIIVTGELSDARSHHTAILLPSASGEVLVAGGKNASGAIKSCELYTPALGTWTPTGDMGGERFDHTATLLKDGRVLVTGGECPGGYMGWCEVYNSGSWSTTGDMATPRARHSAIILLDGNILVIGGQTTGGATDVCEIWNGTSWSPAGNLTTARYLHTATLLQSGDVLVTGGTSDGSTPIASCEIYSGGSWSAEADLNEARYLHNTTLLYSGLVLVTGGNSGSNSCEIWDPAAEWDSLTNTHGWKVTAPLATGRAYHSSVLVPDTMPFVLAIGGKSGAGYLNSIEEYDVGLGYRSIWQSTITNYPAVTLIDSAMDIEGTLFRGVSEADGGNHCHIMSNDHPIISLVRIGGGNWQGNGGGEILHMPLSSSWDEVHTDVHPEIADFQGHYRLWSIVNGIPCKWYEECQPSGAEEDVELKIKSVECRVYPNPSSTTGVRFQVSGVKLSSHQAIKLSIYDLSGRLVRKTTENYTETGAKEIKLDGLKAGIYFYRIEYGDSENKGKFIITR